jgi:hypothetical protein
LVLTQDLKSNPFLQKPISQQGEKMTAHVQTIAKEVAQKEQPGSKGQTIYALGGIAALLVVLTAIAEIGITFLPGGYLTADTVTEWFALLQSNPFMGLRNLGLLNIIMTACDIPLVFALFWVHRKVNQPFASLALILSLIGTTVFYATNRAFPMLDLSAQYAAATSDVQRAVLEAAGQAMLSVGQSHTAGTFLAFFFAELGGICMAWVILRGKVFSAAPAIAGLLGFSGLLVFEVFSDFVPSGYEAMLPVAMISGLANIAWYILLAIGLFKIAKSDTDFAA